MRILRKNKSIELTQDHESGRVLIGTNKYRTLVPFSRLYSAITNLCQEIEGERAKKKRK